MGIISAFKKFFGMSEPAPLRDLDEAGQRKYHRSLAFQSFVAGTLGYSFYYVCRAALNVMKKPIIDSGLLDADQLGTIGAVTLATYAIGKFVNGFLADYSNIKRFMATGLIISTIACFFMGVIGMSGSKKLEDHNASKAQIEVVANLEAEAVAAEANNAELLAVNTNADEAQVETEAPVAEEKAEVIAETAAVAEAEPVVETETVAPVAGEKAETLAVAEAPVIAEAPVVAEEEKDPEATQISFLVFIAFAILWGMSGWGQSMGAPPAIIALSRWFPLSKRGTYYGFFSASHNIGEWLSFIFVGLIVATAGWQWGFFGAAIAGIIGVVIILFMMHDTPESKGLPSIEQLTGDKAESKKKDESLKEIQKQVLKNPAVWILALASAFMYISRYSLNSWGVLFLQKEKGFDLAEATFIISINALLGILGTVLAGWMSDSLFKGDRKMPAFVSGVLLSISYALFIYGGNEYWVNILSMVLFGIAIGVLIAFLGGLMAVDIVPRKATGAALGVVGMASYIAAGLQDVISPWLIREKKTTVDIAPETQELYQNIINTAQTDIPNATETVSKISENLDVLKEGVLNSEMTGQVSQEFAKKFLDMQDKFGELGDEFVKGTDHISDKVVNLAEKALEKGSVVVETYDFSDAAIFWIGASVISFLLPMLLWGKKKVEE